MSKCIYCTFNVADKGTPWTDEDGDQSYIMHAFDAYYIVSVDGGFSADIEYCPKCGRKLTGDDKQPIDSQFKDYTDKLAETLSAKNKDYGNSFDKTLDKYGLIALAIRLDDKLSRLTSLTKGETQHVKDESLKDTLQDIAGYAILGVRYLDQR